MPRQIAAIAPVNNTTTKRPTATVKSARRNTIVLNLSPFTTQTRQESTTEYFKLELRGAADCCKLCEAGDHPIRMLHGISDDYVEIAPCRDYFARLKQTAKDVQMTEYPDTWHAFDYPLFPTTPTVVQNGQTTHCVLKQQPVGTIINMATQKPFTYADACMGRNPHVTYSASSTHATEEAVKELLKTVFKLD